ncbi:MAG: TetM/TetW/TetO/TetS family tetracycline resistance ribosomal protection protein [Prevotella sp.]|nr:TetM/TetW/TetO/TetS family tetracycline resistance ribosomal protection protein [Prevotella sp.]
MKRLVLGMTAHVDSGKTTLSEAMLYTAGELRRLGRVDKGDAFLDTHSIERSRGITVFSKQAVMRRGEDVYTLFDTPGHADFSAETERALRVLDYAVLVISGTDGVQSHTETLWRLLRRYSIPTVIFVNKMDISAYSPSVLMSGLKSRLDKGCVDFSSLAAGGFTEEFFEETALLSEDMMNAYLDTGKLSRDDIRRAVSERKLFPCFFGSALKLEGISEFLAGLDFCTAEKSCGKEFGARVCKITEEQGVRLTHLKITGGTLRTRDTVGEEKVTRIRVYSGAKYQTADEVCGGTLCAVEGLSKTRAGDGLGFESAAEVPLLEPVMSYRLILPEGADEHGVLTKIRKLEEEDPQLHAVWNDRSREISVQLMGEIQLEILKTLIAERFGLEVGFDRGSIIYKETIANTVEGAGHYEPLRHYAEVHLLLEPTERGSGLTFASDISADDLDKNWQRLILTHLEEKTHVGVLTGSPITDMKITLIGGRAHIKHTEGGDFRQATYRAVRQGLRSAESVLLEPWYSFTLEIPTDTAGRIMSDLQIMGAEFSPPCISESNSENSVITGAAPASEMAGYQSRVTSCTKGRGRLSLALKGYFPCHNAEKVIAAIGYDCGADLDNTADSVFCSHGAGHTVSWDEAPAHMHIPCRSVRKNSGTDGESFSEITPRQVSDYRARLAEDKELMEIFERTYGKINRDPRHALRTEKTPKSPAREKKAAPLPKGPEYLLVDGYNIIFAWDELKKLAEENLDLARSTLINRLCNYRGFRRCELILVFDAYKVRGFVREVEQICGISVVYTKESETADTYIEKVSHELSRDHRVRVATSDGAEQIIILGNGAYRVSAEELHREVEAVEKAIRDIIG